MPMVCRKCGGGKFYATQVVTGTITVEVDAYNNFVGNTTEDGGVDESALEFGDPEGPYECVGCNGTDVDGGPS